MSIEIVQTVDYDTVVLPLAIRKFKNSSNLLGEVSTNNTQLNDLEEAIFEVRDEFWLDTAVGVQLDAIGQIKNVDRNGLSDEDYRSQIKEQIGIRVSGTPEDIIAISTTLYGGSYNNYIPAYPYEPASYYLYTDSNITNKLLEKFSPSGVLGMKAVPIYDAGTGSKKIVDALGRVILTVPRFARSTIHDEQSNELVNEGLSFITAFHEL